MRRSRRGEAAHTLAGLEGGLEALPHGLEAALDLGDHLQWQSAQLRGGTPAASVTFSFFSTNFSSWVLFEVSIVATAYRWHPPKLSLSRRLLLCIPRRLRNGRKWGSE